MNDWTAIFTTDQLYQAEMIKSILEDNCIEAVILNQKDSSFKVGTINVMVKEEDKEQAEKLINSVGCE